ncbi:aldehyde dehydrogenase family protein [Labrys wisconsinensis]|uniref:Acyl-CoA reductase-like NAD-dependent aldehyde dehydrogenase n=1 Tax=Labrys wisconsinensis TaxID=425677 RepID=A0ABU0JKM0_9HYPH|nr:aldehyde dehydrogenase family protein [Labrys wisconsinensis]MDQ0474135.1 acyl-CoA reductase-like NAD-dependent aldehyde dehydrogenase [Labrys wisconsinensis]
MNEIPRTASVIEARTYRQLVGGELGEALSGARLERLSPAHDVKVGDYPLADAADADRAVAAARAAFDRGPWPRMSGAERSRMLLRIADLIEAHGEALARADVLESGKPISQARGEMAGAVDLWRYAAGQARALHGSVPSALGADMLGLIKRDPIGVVAMITPWNFPFVIASQKLPFALAAGCTVVIKPSELTPGSTLHLGELLVEAGLPAGVVNIIVGYGNTVGQRLAEHEAVDMISFTGSTAVGRTVARAAAGNLKKVALELGGKNPLIVCADADLEAAADAAVFGVFFNAGQCCNSSSRLLVDAAVAEDFVGRLEALTRTLAVGDPLDPATKVGAIVNDAQLAKIEGYLGEIAGSGAVLRAGGRRMATARGRFVEPTLVTGVRPDMRIAREEIFGPVLSILPFDDLGEAIAVANDTHYGLSAGIWTRDHEAALRAAEELRAGTVWVNGWMEGYPEMPFGGMGQSGLGREQGAQAVEEFTELKSVLFHRGPRTRWWARPSPSA